MIARYSRPAMAKVWSDERKLATWLEVELAALDAWAEVGAIPEEVARRVRVFLQFAPPERLVFSTDCGLSQTARWAARQKLANLVAGVGLVNDEL